MPAREPPCGGAAEPRRRRSGGRRGRHGRRRRRRRASRCCAARTTARPPIGGQQCDQRRRPRCPPALRAGRLVRAGFGGSTNCIVSVAVGERVGAARRRRLVVVVGSGGRDARARRRRPTRPGRGTVGRRRLRRGRGRQRRRGASGGTGAIDVAPSSTVPRARPSDRRRSRRSTPVAAVVMTGHPQMLRQRGRDDRDAGATARPRRRRPGRTGEFRCAATSSCSDVDEIRERSADRVVEFVAGDPAPRRA